MENGQVPWVPATCVGDVDRVPGAGLQLSKALVPVAVWVMNQWMKDALMNCWADGSGKAKDAIFHHTENLLSFRVTRSDLEIWAVSKNLESVVCF